MLNFTFIPALSSLFSSLSLFFFFNKNCYCYRRCEKFGKLKNLLLFAFKTMLAKQSAFSLSFTDMALLFVTPFFFHCLVTGREYDLHRYVEILRRRDHVGDAVYLISKIAILLPFVFNILVGMNDAGMVLVECLADFRIRCLGQDP